MSNLSKNSILYMPRDNASPLGVIYIIHGMADYQGRYREFAQYMSNNGFAAVTCDLRGHGNNVNRKEELGFIGDNALQRLIGDIHENIMYIREHFPDVPVVMFGQDLGALLATVYFKRYDNFLDGLFLSGMPQERSGLSLTELFIQLMILFRGEYTRSPLVDHILTSGYSREFKNESPYAWLTADDENVKRFESDPKTGFYYTLNGYKALTEIMLAAYKKGSWIKKRPKCPIRLFFGEDDPCVNGVQGIKKTVHLFSDNGYQNVAFITYPGQRHEVFQDIRKDTAFKDALNQMKEIRKNKLQGKEAVKAEKKPTHIVLEDFIDPELALPPVKEPEPLNLEDFINANQELHPDDTNDVQMIDFDDIVDDLISSESE